MEQKQNEFAAAFALMKKCYENITSGRSFNDEESMDALALRLICKKYLREFDQRLEL